MTTVEIDAVAGIERLTDGDLGPGIAEAVWPGKDLKEHVIKADNVVLGDDPLVLEAEGSVCLGSAEAWPVGKPGGFGCDREAPVEAGKEGREKGVCLRDGGDPG